MKKFSFLLLIFMSSMANAGDSEFRINPESPTRYDQIHLETYTTICETFYITDYAINDFQIDVTITSLWCVIGTLPPDMHWTPVLLEGIHDMWPEGHYTLNITTERQGNVVQTSSLTFDVLGPNLPIAVNTMSITVTLLLVLLFVIMTKTMFTKRPKNSQ